MKNINGDCVTDQNLLKEMVVGYFRNWYSKDLNQGDLNFPISDNFPKLDRDVLSNMEDVFSDDENKNAVFSMSPLKA